MATKGAPEAIFDLCHLPSDQVEALLGQVRAMADQGLRVLAVARGKLIADAPLSDQLHDFAFDYLGLVALSDPIRQEVPLAIEQCHKAGIRLLMITGDFPATAMSIARQAGILSKDAAPVCLTGGEVSAMDDTRLQEALKTCHVIARAAPDIKLRIVRALQANGEVVAMTGDGVNDAPALKAANIGIAMGGRGTDVAREAADLILTDDRFSSIVSAIRLGRRVYTNLTKASGYIVAIHIPIAGLSMLPVLFGGPLMLLPIHVAFLELMIDPACSVAFEAEPDEPRAMLNPPRQGRASLFGAMGVWPWVFQGLSLMAVVVLVHEWARHDFESPAMVRTLSFGMLVLGNLSLITSHGWKQANPAMLAVLVGTAFVLSQVLLWPWSRDLFHLTMPTWQAAAGCGILATILVPWLVVIRSLGVR
jgi:Ca2+-transporting ATPase